VFWKIVFGFPPAPFNLGALRMNLVTINCTQPLTAQYTAQEEIVKISQS